MPHCLWGLDDVSISYLLLCSGPWDTPDDAWIPCRVSLRSPWGLEVATPTDTYQRLDDDNEFRRAHWELKGKVRGRTSAYFEGGVTPRWAGLNSKVCN